uniref:Histone H1 n=1 Tax=Seriola dumerili TaxID=41447 RepID=A0A3B4T3T0_SERDU
MAEVAPAPAPAAAPAKAAKKKASKPRKVGPSLGELIVNAVAASKERSGVSAAALKKALAAGGYDVEKNKARVKTAIKSLVAKGTLVQTKGTGASGSFKMNKKSGNIRCCKSFHCTGGRCCSCSTTLSLHLSHHHVETTLYPTAHILTPDQQTQWCCFFGLKLR